MTVRNKDRNSMKRIALLGSILLLTGLASAETFTYTPDPENLDSFPHNRTITWGIDVSAVVGMQVNDVELYIDDISNWDDGENVLHIHMMNNQPFRRLRGTGRGRRSLGGPERRGHAGQPLVLGQHPEHRSSLRRLVPGWSSGIRVRSRLPFLELGRARGDHRRTHDCRFEHELERA